MIDSIIGTLIAVALIAAIIGMVRVTKPGPAAQLFTYFVTCEEGLYAVEYTAAKKIPVEEVCK